MNATASYLPPHSKLNYQTLANMSTPIIPTYLNNTSSLLNALSLNANTLFILIKKYTINTISINTH